MIQELEKRFYKEVKNLTNNDIKNEVKIEAGNKEKYGVWTGGAMSTMSGFQLRRITKAEYEESEDLIVHNKYI